MASQERIAKLVVSCRLTDLSYFSEFVEERGAKLPAGELTRPELEALVLKYFVAPFISEEEAGFEFVEGTQCTFLSDTQFQIQLVARVFDAQALYAQSCVIRCSCWGDLDWVPTSAEESIFELALASNANPSPADIGVSIGDWAPL